MGIKTVAVYSTIDRIPASEFADEAVWIGGSIKSIVFTGDKIIEVAKSLA
jgi:acetyl/propionyl-CoA carboxylase alpha subunit